jgi:anti-anti-sigma factor
MELVRSAYFVTSTSGAPRSAEGFANLVWLRGEHDCSTVAAATEVIDRAIAFGGVDVVVDLEDVSFMDAATVGLIARASERLEIRARSLVLRSPSPCARRILELCRLSHLIDPEPCAAPPLPVGAYRSAPDPVAPVATAPSPLGRREVGDRRTSSRANPESP